MRFAEIFKTELFSKYGQKAGCYINKIYDIMKDIVVDDDDFVNNSTVMNGMADGSIKVKDNKEYSSKILGGQNPLPMYCAGVETLDLSNLSSYDQGCNEEFQNAMKNYFEGKATKDEALDLFYKAVTEKYPELTY